MAGLGDNVGLLFRIKADSSDAIKDLNKVQTEVAGVNKSFLGIANPAALAATAITAIAASAAAAAVGIFNLAKETSDYGSKIFDATQKTGLSAETISSLGYAADQSGSSLEKISGSVAKFSTLLGQAANGNEKAQKTLADYGITAKETDQALIQAVSTIAKMTDTTKQSAAAAALFKDRTGEILPVIKSFDGDLPGLIEKLQKMGVVMSDEDARAADEFGDTLDNLNKQATAFGRQMALEFMPAITSAMAAISASMGNNKDVAQGWGRALAETMDGVTAVYRAGVSVFDSVFNAIGAGFLSTAEKARIFAGVMISALSPVLGILNLIGRTSGLNAQIGGSVNIPDTPNFKMPKLSGVGGGGSNAPRDTSAQDAERLAKRDNQAGISLEKKNLETIKANMRKEFESLREQFAASPDEELLIEKSNEAIQRFAEAMQTSLSYLDALENKARATMTENEQALLTADQLERRDQAVLAGKLEIKKAQEAMPDVYKDQDAAAEILFNAEMKRSAERIEAAEKEREAQKKITDELISQHQLAIAKAIGTPNAPPEMTTGAIAQAAAIDTLRDAFQGLGQAIGQAVQAWILYGNVGGQSARKVTAQILASIAQQAVVKSIFHLAEGFADLAVGNGPGAALHFKSAAMFGVVAGVAAVAGRAVAGNSFAQSTAGGGAGTGSQAQQNNNFGGFFNGFQQRQDRLISTVTDRANAVMGAAASAIDRFNEKFGVTTPDAVVMAGAGGAGAAIFDATINQMEKGGGASEMFGRASGRFR